MTDPLNQEPQKEPEDRFGSVEYATENFEFSKQKKHPSKQDPFGSGENRSREGHFLDIAGLLGMTWLMILGIVVSLGLLGLGVFAAYVVFKAIAS